MSVAIRSATIADAEACGSIIYDAFSGIARAHGFPADFPSPEAGVELAGNFIAHPAIFAVVAEQDGRIVGSNFLLEGDAIRGVGPITVAPAAQGSGVGRRLMLAVLERAEGAPSVRLVQDSFNTRSIALYASLGFEVKEPLLLIEGTPRGAVPSGSEVRPLVEADLDACAELCARTHGVARTGELNDALQLFTPFVVERDGRVTGYLSASTFWLANHGVAETEEDMQALLLGAAAMSSGPVALLLPTRQARLFRWCLEKGMRAVKPMILMAMGSYQEPRGPYFPSVFY
ncbi:MAG TPA: GNAT family N-acetyltransferase [Geminicoccaceae bacterium]|nr:GNAT family N-acetyltransferase [Geminicoccaceae bacterium]